MEHRQEQVRLETERHQITGEATLPRDGYRSRVSDLLNASEREFIPLTNVTLVPHDGGATEHRDFVAVARRHIVFATTDGT